eukprot:jgi/Mesvir1/15979/Mv26463-RA.1
MGVLLWGFGALDQKGPYNWGCGWLSSHKDGVAQLVTRPGLWCRVALFILLGHPPPAWPIRASSPVLSPARLSCRPQPPRDVYGDHHGHAGKYASILECSDSTYACGLIADVMCDARCTSGAAGGSRPSKVVCPPWPVRHRMPATVHPCG